MAQLSLQGRNRNKYTSTHQNAHVQPCTHKQTHRSMHSHSTDAVKLVPEVDREVQTNPKRLVDIRIKAYRIEKCSHFLASISLLLTRSIEIESILMDDPTDFETRSESLV